MMHSEIQGWYGALVSSRPNPSPWATACSRAFVSRPNGLKAGCQTGRKIVRSTGLRENGSWAVVRASVDGEKSTVLKKKEHLEKTQVLEKVTLKEEGNRTDGVVEVQIENLGNNSRKIIAKIAIDAHLDIVWSLLTDYEHLADFIPGLAVSELLEKRHNGARLYQVGEQNLALGLKFKAKAVVDCVEKPKEMVKDFIRRDVDFDTVEGDFQIFRGTWRMEQPVGKIPSSSHSAAAAGVGAKIGENKATLTILSYILTVQPKIWLPVGLVEGRITSEVKTNLVCIRDKSHEHSSR